MIDFLRIGIITTTFGLKGEIKVFSTTDDIKRFTLLDDIYIIDDKEYDSLSKDSERYKKEVADVKLLNDKVVLKLHNIDTIDEAKKFINKSIYIKRKDAVSLINNEYYVADIIDKELILDGKVISIVKDLMFTGSNANLIADIDGKEILIPMIDDFVDNIDLINNKIYLKTIAGLTDL